MILPLVGCILGTGGIVTAAVVWFRSRLAISVLRDEMQRSNRTVLETAQKIVGDAQKETERSNRELFTSTERIVNDFRDEIDDRFHVLATKVPAQDDSLKQAFSDLAKVLAKTPPAPDAARIDVRKEMAVAAQAAEDARPKISAEESARRSGLMAPMNRPKE